MTTYIGGLPDTVVQKYMKPGSTRQDALDAAYDNPENQPSSSTALDDTKSLIGYAIGAQQGASNALNEDQIRLMLKYNPALLNQQIQGYKSLVNAEMDLNPKLYAQQQSLLRQYNPYQYAAGETLAADATARLTGDSPVPQNVVDLMNRARLESDNARGMPFSGVGSQAAADAVAQLGLTQRQQDVNTLLALSGKMPADNTNAVSASQIGNTQSVGYSPQSANVLGAASGLYGSLMGDEYARSGQKLGYLLQKDQQSSGGLGSLLGAGAGALLGGITGGMGTVLGGTLGSKIGF